MGSDKPFLSFLVDPDLLKRLDDFRFKHRFESRAAAIKWLLAWALDQKPAPAKGPVALTRRMRVSGGRVVVSARTLWRAPSGVSKCR